MAKFKKGDRIRVTGKVNLLLENHTAPEATFEADVVEITKVHYGYAHAALLFYSITSDELTELTKEKDVMVQATQLDACAALEQWEEKIMTKDSAIPVCFRSDSDSESHAYTVGQLMEKLGQLPKDLEIQQGFGQGCRVAVVTNLSSYTDTLYIDEIAETIEYEDEDE